MRTPQTTATPAAGAPTAAAERRTTGPATPSAGATSPRDPEDAPATATEPLLATEIELPAIGEPESLRVRTRRLAAPAKGEALVRVEATGVSFAEQQMRRGKYYDQPAFPFVPGYDLVGVVEAIGPGGDASLVGRRVAAVTKTGAWADRVVLPTLGLAAVPDGLDPAAAETAVVNGLTAWRMLHRTARVRRGDTVVVLGAAGGVGSLLVQLAVAAGATVIGVAGARQLEQVRALGAEPVDHRAEDVAARVRELGPDDGVAAVFDHVGGPGIADSWRMLARGGTLVSYGTAATKDRPGNPRLPVLRLLLRLAAWNALPNGRRARFFDLWAGRRRHPARYAADVREDLAAIFALLHDGSITPQIAAVYPLQEAAAAMRRAEAGGLTGKVILRPSGIRA